MNEPTDKVKSFVVECATRPVKCPRCGHSDIDKYSTAPPAPGPSDEQLHELMKWWRDRFDDIVDDCDTILNRDKLASEAELLGIRTVAEQQRDSIERTLTREAVQGTGKTTTGEVK